MVITNQTKHDNNLHHEWVSLEESKQLPVQPVREIGQDIVMGDGNNMSSVSDQQMVIQEDVILDTSRQDNILARRQQ